MKQVTIHTDGACQGNPGPGGWAAVLQHGVHSKELAGGNPATTNNRMELQAAIAALTALKQPCQVTLFTDSQYLRQGITGWIRAWKARGWLTLERQPVKNDDLWRALDAVCSQHQVNWKWLKGHAGHPLNERCDALARSEIAKLHRQFTRQQLADSLHDFQDARRPGRNQMGLL